MAKIMIVDDEPNVVFLVKKMLTKEGYEVIGANSGEDALELLKGVKPDLILLDIMMPKLSGWEVLEEIMRDDNLRKVPVAMFTVKQPTPELLRKERVEGLVGYITKPFTSEKVVKSVKEILNTIGDLGDVKERLRDGSEEMAEEYDRVVKALMLHRNLLDSLQEIFKLRKEEGTLTDSGMFENVIASQSRMINYYEGRQKELKSLIKFLKKLE